MSADCEDLKPPEIPMEQLGKDQDYVTETVEKLGQAIAPDMPWRASGGTRKCLGEHDQIRGYKTRHFLDITSKDVGRDIDDERAFAVARAWLTNQGYEFIRDTQRDNGTREIRAVKEGETDGIGISVTGHPGIIGITGTTKCRP